MSGAVSDGVNVIQRGAAAEIDVDPVRPGSARSNQRRDRRYHSDADNYHVAGDFLTAVQHHPGYSACILTQNRTHAFTQAHINALTAMFCGVEIRHFRARHARQQAGEHFHQHDLAAQFAQHCRRFQPDIAAADHDGPLCPARQRGHHRIGIALVAHIEHAG